MGTYELIVASRHRDNTKPKRHYGPGICGKWRVGHSHPAECRKGPQLPNLLIGNRKQTWPHWTTVVPITWSSNVLPVLCVMWLCMVKSTSKNLNIWVNAWAHHLGLPQSRLMFFEKIEFWMPRKLAKTMKIFVEIEHIENRGVTFWPERTGPVFPTLWSGHEFSHGFATELVTTS